MPILFAIVGATGTGKSGVAVELAARYGADIIGVDSRQVYKGFAIGTAQPSVADMEKVKHHMVNFLEPEKVFSAGDFCANVRELLAANPDRKFIAVGGTGLYMQSLMLGLPQIPKVAPEMRAEIEKLGETSGVINLFKMAREVDPEAMVNVDEHNVQRIVRILEVFRATGRKLSDWQKERVGGIGSLPVFWFDRPREELYARIDARVDQMMSDGWMEEVLRLAEAVPLTAPAWQSLGYRELLCAKSSSEIAHVIDDVKRKTRNYAKRQLTWFRGQMKTTRIDMSGSDANAIYRQIADCI
ncbi:MAG: tRNA (adenosine(37)-N6)-dimethylallyltransferase MiaA [Fibrobacter sp.]|nr:tRNA (adenosine(37)-N6)-dimethylallyltransferase MiaA [Fibrobacter sp.]